MEKNCNVCNRLLPLSNFAKNYKCKDGHINKCKDCRRGYLKDYYDVHRKTAKGRAMHAFAGIKQRVGIHPAYKHVELRMTKQEFYKWAIPEYERFLTQFPGETPSVDRINPKGHYELGNIRIIAMKDNAQRAAVSYYTRIGEEQAKAALVSALRNVPLTAY